MNRRTKGRSKMNKATKELELYYIEFENEFIRFFKELIDSSKTKRIALEKAYNL